MNTKLLLTILILSALLRFYKLGSFPVSLSWDEVAISYNAFSISQTGKDEYGAKWPLLFKSFNDYKLPGYIYLDSIFVKFLGLSESSARFPSALFGVLAVVFIYFLTKKMFEKSNWKLQIGNCKLEIANLSALMLAISPWHLQFSRAAFEANAALSIVLMGMVFLLYGLKNRILALFSIPTLALSIYFYYSPRVFVPAILIVFFLIYRTQIAKNFKYYLFGLALSIFLLIPISIQILSQEGMKRVKEVSIFVDKSQITSYVDARAKNDSPLSTIFLNRRIPLVFESLHGYFSHFSPGFLFFGDDPNPRHRSSFHGNLYIFEIPLVSLGLWTLLKSKDSQVKYFLLAWLLISPLPAAFTREIPHALRSLLMLPPLIIFSAIGLAAIAKKGYLKVIIAPVLVIFLVNYFYSYYIIYPLKDNLAWAYGYKQMLSSVAKIENNFDRIIVTGYYWKPYIFYLFYNKIDPSFYQSTSTQQSIDKYRFGTTGWDSGGKNLDNQAVENLKSNKTLLVISQQELNGLQNKDKFAKLMTIKDYSGKNDIFLIGEWR